MMYHGGFVHILEVALLTLGKFHSFDLETDAILEVLQHVQSPFELSEVWVSKRLSAEITVPPILSLVKQDQVGGTKDGQDKRNETKRLTKLKSFISFNSECTVDLVIGCAIY